MNTIIISVRILIMWGILSTIITIMIQDWKLLNWQPWSYSIEMFLLYPHTLTHRSAHKMTHNDSLRILYLNLYTQFLCHIYSLDISLWFFLISDINWKYTDLYSPHYSNTFIEKKLVQNEKVLNLTCLYNVSVLPEFWVFCERLIIQIKIEMEHL